MTRGLHVQYGCGFSAPEGWINFDSSPTLRFERLPLVGRLYTKNAQRFPASVRYGDIVRGLPIPPRSCAGLYASHVLEHLSLGDLRIALAHSRSYLAEGGVFRLIVPDLRVLAEIYLRDAERGDEGAAHRFMESSGLGRERSTGGTFGWLRDALGARRHHWLYDAPALKRELHDAGFQHVRDAAFGDADDPMFARVEDIGRFENAVAIEAR